MVLDATSACLKIITVFEKLFMKKYSVKPIVRPGRQSYSATFRDASGNRITRGLQTKNHSLAEITCIWLQRLWTDKVRQPNDAPPDCPHLARDLYFGRPMKTRKASEAKPFPPDDLCRMSPEAKAYLAQLCGELNQKSELILVQQAEIKTLKESLSAEEARHHALARTVLAQAVSAGERSPAIQEALSDFEKHLEATVTPGYRKTVMGLCRDFTATLPENCRSLADVTVEQICRFLDAKSIASQPSQPLTRYTRYRIKLGRLINWAAQRWGYPSQMTGVRALTNTVVDRERNEIHWHDLADVEAVLCTLDAYWAALVATLAYSGLQLAELVWMRRADLLWGPEQASAQLRVATVVETADAKHFLKSSHRRRTIAVHSRLLLPRLREHLMRQPDGEYLFPMPPDRARRRRRQTPGSPDRWRVEGLSSTLRGHHGGKRHRPTPGILPAGMTAQSLRRTFGSLMIRAGATEAQVAAAMGNTPDVVRQHYARILGCEVDVDF